MRSTATLPCDYQEIFKVDLKKDKKLSLIINLAAVIVAAAMIVPVCFFIPISVLFDMSQGFIPYLIRFAMLMVASVAYIILHELTHGIAMKLCGTKKIKYGFTGLYAFAGSEDYYGKGAYIFIALAPVVLWGIILAILCPLLPTHWFWVGYLIQVSNISGAMGDAYVTAKFCRMPRDILIRDWGVGMCVYSKQNGNSQDNMNTDIKGEENA